MRCSYRRALFCYHIILYILESLASIDNERISRLQQGASRFMMMTRFHYSKHGHVIEAFLAAASPDTTSVAYGRQVSVRWRRSLHGDAHRKVAASIESRVFALR